MLKYFTTLKSDEIDSIAIGGFDGMHLGHMALVKRLTHKGVILVIDKGFSNLTPHDNRCEYVKNGCIFLNLMDIKNLTSDEFVKLLESEFKNLKEIVVGYDFRYGVDRKGDIKTLKNQFNGKVNVIKELKIDNISVHSGAIRDHISSKNIKKANQLLGRAYLIESNTIKGQGIGKKELVATINLDKSDYLLPSDGVYASRTQVKDRWYKSVTFVGVRISCDGKSAVETHLVDEDIEFLPSSVRVEFNSFIRENRKFDSLNDLKKQIQIDIEKASYDSK